MKPKIFITRNLPKNIIDLIAAECEVGIWPHDEPAVPRDVLLRAVRDVQGIFSLITDRMDAEMMDAAPQLKVISNMAVGYDNIVVKEATARKIPVGNTPGVLTETTADLTWALILGGARRMGESIEYIKQNQWKTWLPFGLLGSDVTSKTLGIIGMGRIGHAVAKRARGFDMRVLYYNRQRHPEYEQDTGAQYVSLETLLAQSDYVSVNCPLNDSTRYIINANTLKLMKRTAILVNTSRGGTVEPQALYEALKNGTIAYAALDVTEPEPIGADYPLLSLPNCLILPHLGSSTIETRLKMATMAARNLMAGVKGERLPNCVNPEVYG